jgi:hypothetical protein
MTPPSLRQHCTGYFVTMTERWSRVSDSGNGDNGHIEMQSYTGAPTEEDEDFRGDEGSADGADEDTPALRGRRGGRRAMATQSTHFLCVWFLLLISFLLVVCVALFSYRKTSLQHHSDLSERKSPGGNPKLASFQHSSLHRSSVHYDSSVLSNSWDPFNLTTGVDNGNPLLPPSLPWKQPDNNEDVGLGFYMQPDIVNDNLVFVSEGDVYWTRLSAGKHMPAVRLTTTVGNVRSPKINPVHPNLIAYTATYAARRDVYLLDLSQPSAAQRLTYWPVSFGVSNVVGWVNNGKTLVFSAATLSSNSLPDAKLFELALYQDGNETFSPALQIQPIPLAQALDGAFVSSGGEDCIYFTRFSQSSHTARYVGGTAESLWAYCHGRDLAVHLTSDYIGASKSPSILTMDDGSSYLLFLSDRSPASDGSWKPTAMDLWAVPLPSEADLYDSGDTVSLLAPVQLTRVSCQFSGQALREYALDSVTGGVVLRIGADLHYLSPEEIQKGLRDKTITVPNRLNVHALSDFREQQERLIPVKLPHGLTGADVFETCHGGTAMLLTIRGQVWVAPVVADSKGSIPYQGAGQNLPERRYRVLPGQMTGGSTRVLKAVHVPLLLSDDDDNDKRRVAVVLATDPLSPTAEHAFYLVDVHSGSINSFASLHRLPKPFLGGHVNGGSSKDGGLGSVHAPSLEVSPCGRRMAWTDKDGRICVMTLPLYDGNSTSYHVLPSENELGEPMNGALSSLSWSPGGRYLAVGHTARNQFAIITIVDCGHPGNSTQAGSVADIEIGRAAQATPSRFNADDMYWGKSPMDIYLNQHWTILSKILKIPAPDDVATTLYFLTDRDIVSDVGSPWGTRAPSPHFPLKYSVYALPLTPKAVAGEVEVPFLGRFPGGGALELFTDELAAFDKKLKNLANTTTVASEDRRKLRDTSMSLRRALKERRLTRQHFRSVQRYLNATEADGDDDVSSHGSDSDPLEDEEDGSSQFPVDMDIDFGQADLTFARTAYRLAHIPEGKYINILSQTNDDGSIVLVEVGDAGYNLKVFCTDTFPSDKMDTTAAKMIVDAGVSTCRGYIYILVAGSDSPRVVSNTMASLMGFLADLTAGSTKNIADTSSMAISVWPVLEYQQMFSDAWRMLRDYFYDVDMHKVDWPAVHDRYKALVSRCGKREELDDVLGESTKCFFNAVRKLRGSLTLPIMPYCPLLYYLQVKWLPS